MNPSLSGYEKLGMPTFNIPLMLASITSGWNDHQPFSTTSKNVLVKSKTLIRRRSSRKTDVTTLSPEDFPFFSPNFLLSPDSSAGSCVFPSDGIGLASVIDPVSDPPGSAVVTPTGPNSLRKSWN